MLELFKIRILNLLKHDNMNETEWPTPYESLPHLNSQHMRKVRWDFKLLPSDRNPILMPKRNLIGKKNHLLFLYGFNKLVSQLSDQFYCQQWLFYDSKLTVIYKLFIQSNYIKVLADWIFKTSLCSHPERKKKNQNKSTQNFLMHLISMI